MQFPSGIWSWYPTQGGGGGGISAISPQFLQFPLLRSSPFTAPCTYPPQAKGPTQPSGRWDGWGWAQEGGGGRDTRWAWAGLPVPADGQAEEANPPPSSA